MPKKQTGKMAASLAAIWLDCEVEDLMPFYDDDDLSSLVKILRTLSGSVLSQDETPDASDNS